MAKIKGTVIVNTERCKGCSVCVVSCPTHALALAAAVNSKGYNYCQLVKPDECIGCASCAIICPDSCIEVYKQKFD